MKYCPNVACPFLLETGNVAEYQDRVNICLDCGEVLETGSAPELKVPTNHPAYWQQQGATDHVTSEPDRVVSLCILELEEDARFFKEKLEYQGIPTALVPVESDNAEGALMGGNVQFELRVLNADLTRATHFLETLDAFADEALDAEGEDELEDGSEDESEDESAVEYDGELEDTFAAEPHPDLQHQRRQAPNSVNAVAVEENKTQAQSSAVYQGQISEVTTSNGVNKLIPLFILVILVLAGLLWLMRT